MYGSTTNKNIVMVEIFLKSPNVAVPYLPKYGTSLMEVPLAEEKEQQNEYDFILASLCA